MGAGELLTLAGQFGPMGLMIGYMVWRETAERALQKERIETDKAIATAMTLLSARIEGLLR
jgi:hypothetical protein